MTSILVVLDVDSTLIDEEVIELIAAEAGREAEVREVTERAMRGEIDFADSLRHRVRALAGLELAAIDRAAARVHHRRPRPLLRLPARRWRPGPAQSVVGAAPAPSVPASAPATAG